MLRHSQDGLVASLSPCPREKVDPQQAPGGLRGPLDNRAPVRWRPPAPARGRLCRVARAVIRVITTRHGKAPWPSVMARRRRDPSTSAGRLKQPGLPWIGRLAEWPGLSHLDPVIQASW